MRRFWHAILAVLFFLGNGLTLAGTDTAPQRIIIDTDPGTDDAMAILLALNSPELKVEAITIVAGNATAEQGLENALRLVTLAGQTHIPVSAGAVRPLLQPLVTAESHGPTGMGDAVLPAAACDVDPRFGPDLIIELIHRYPHEITLVPLGPLTNLALALAKDPSIAGLVREVVLMGGSITTGNVDAVSEFNIHVDPEAAQMVFQGGWPLTMVGLEIGREALFKPVHLERLRRTRGAQSDFAADVLAFRIKTSQEYGWEGTPIYDATAMGSVIDRTLIETEFFHVNVELCGTHTRAMTVANRQNAINRKVPQDGHLVFQGIEPLEPNVHVAIHIDEERFQDLLIRRLAGK